MYTVYRHVCPNGKMYIGMTSKEVCQYSLNDELIKIFESIGEAERITGISHQQISDCCNGKQKTCHGYIWKYKTA